MSDVVVTVPKNFTMDYDGLRPGLEQWLGEGDAPGQTWTGQEWDFTACGSRPNIATGERVYVVCNGNIAPIQNPVANACLCDCLHVDDVAEFLKVMGLDKRPAGK